MKSLFIVILSGLLGAGLFMSHPGQATFAAFLAQSSAAAPQPNLIARIFKKGSAENNARSYNFHDCYLWSTAERDGRTVYIGVFSRWFKIGETK